jgi:ferredoxin-thioredoxin reductase catalytic subunit/rubredoxin
VNLEVDDAEVDDYYQRLKKQVESIGYHLNPDVEFTKSLLKSIIINERRYGYGACPCRLAANDKEEDLDIICPCDYRDPDLDEYNTCYCGLYISGEILSGKKELKAIPERRPSPDQREKLRASSQLEIPADLPLPVWRCGVCGYLCAREEPPEICPICKVEKKRFQRFM